MTWIKDLCAPFAAAVSGSSALVATVDGPTDRASHRSCGALIAETGRRLDQLELTPGVVGPASLAEQTQTFVHEVTGALEPRGWDTQLKNEPGVVLTYQRNWRGFVSETVSGFGFDATPHAAGAVGNVFTYANAGLMLRFGRRLPSGMRIARLVGPNRPSLNSTRRCALMWRRDLPASSWPRAALSSLVPPFRGRTAGMVRERTGDGLGPGARSRLPDACRSTSRTT